MEEIINGLETNCKVFEFYGTTYEDELKSLKIALKYLSGKVLNEKDVIILEGTGYIWPCLTKNIIFSELPFEDWIDGQLKLTNDYLNKCREHVSHLRNVRESALAIKYAPGGSKNRELSKRFYSRASEQK